MTVYGINIQDHHISCDTKKLNMNARALGRVILVLSSLCPRRGAIRLHHSLRQSCLNRSAANLKDHRLWDQKQVLFLHNLLHSFGWRLHGCCSFPRHMKVECFIFASRSVAPSSPKAQRLRSIPPFHVVRVLFYQTTTCYTCSVDLLVVLSNAPHCFDVSTMHSVPVLGCAHIVWWTAWWMTAEDEVHVYQSPAPLQRM